MLGKILDPEILPEEAGDIFLEAAAVLAALLRTVELLDDVSVVVSRNSVTLSAVKLLQVHLQIGRIVKHL